MYLTVSFAAVFRLFTQRSSPVFGEERCVTSLKTASKETVTCGNQFFAFVHAVKG